MYFAICWNAFFVFCCVCIFFICLFRVFCVLFELPDNFSKHAEKRLNCAVLMCRHTPAVFAIFCVCTDLYTWNSKGMEILGLLPIARIVESNVFLAVCLYWVQGSLHVKELHLYFVWSTSGDVTRHLGRTWDHLGPSYCHFGVILIPALSVDTETSRILSGWIGLWPTRHPVRSTENDCRRGRRGRLPRALLRASGDTVGAIRVTLVDAWSQQGHHTHIKNVGKFFLNQF